MPPFEHNKSIAEAMLLLLLNSKNDFHDYNKHNGCCCTNSEIHSIGFFYSSVLSVIFICFLILLPFLYTITLILHFPEYKHIQNEIANLKSLVLNSHPYSVH